jgi:hypothetical protein
MIARDVNRAIGAARQRFTQHLRHARRPADTTTTSPPCFFTQPQRFFERVRVRLVQFPAGVLIAHPGLRLIDAHLPLAGDDLFDADGYYHCDVLTSLGSSGPSGPRLRPGPG